MVSVKYMVVVLEGKIHGPDKQQKTAYNVFIGLEAACAERPVQFLFQPLSAIEISRPVVFTGIVFHDVALLLILSY
jgi:hypothetical protein